MIGNKFLNALYLCKDENTSLNLLMESLKRKDPALIKSLQVPENIDSCTDDEKRFLTIAAALIDYYLQNCGTEVPDWLRNKQLCFDKPFFFRKD